ncbi:hypothetical protein OF83DRAFT_1051772 [Amylostereum chailletii]|nr:hypothetical protein OF83DRAFT_1051772 [Amylostereum chailletii]
MDSPSSAHEDHLRRLLDQRAARADLHHGRFPSLTEFPDTPSVYSHARFSPRPADFDANTEHFDFAIPPHYRSMGKPSVHTPRLDRERLSDPSASILDLDDDDTYTHPHSPIEDPHSYEDDDDDDTRTDYTREESDEDPRMSVLGPRMRFHSPAPWELEDDTLQEQDEPEDDARSFISKRGRTGFMKTFGIGSSSSKAAGAPRPSCESQRSSGKEKKSFETTSSNVSVSGGALHALTQASMSSTSLSVNTPPSLRNQAYPAPSKARARARTASNTHPSTSSLHPSSSPPVGNFLAQSTNVSPVGLYTRSSSPAPSVFSNALARTDTRTSSRTGSPQSVLVQQEFVHPYANPDVSSPYRESFQLPPVPSNRHAPATYLRESHATESSIGVSMASPSTSAVTINGSTSSSGNNSSDASSLKRLATGLQGRSISSPVPVETSLRVATSHSSIKSRNRETKIFSQSNQLPGWTELPASPTFTLISLQEAQAQAKERSRTTTGQTPYSAPFLHSEPATRSNTELSRNAPRTRARSTSAGVKAINALQNLSIGTPPSSTRTPEEVSPAPQGPSTAPPRLKHKKSGLMRLFNGKDKDAPSLPPLPVVVDALPPAPRTPKLPSSRVPVPSFSSSAPSSTDDMTDKGNCLDGSPRRGSAGRRRHPPPAIFTPSETSTNLLPYSSQEDNRSRSTLVPEATMPTLRAPTPNSAPPGSSEFPSLRLRPISTVFSAHFAEHLMDNDLTSELEPDTSTIASGLSPITPGFSVSSRMSDDRIMLQSDDPSTVIQALQDQLTASRKAWQRQIWELECQVRDLRSEVEEMRAKESSGDHCTLCGRGGIPRQDEDLLPALAKTGTFDARSGVVNRPRARTGVGTRFGAAT